MFERMEQQAPNPARLVEILAEIAAVRQRLQSLADELAGLRARLEPTSKEPRKLQSV